MRVSTITKHIVCIINIGLSSYIFYNIFEFLPTVPPNIDDSLSSSDVIVREGSNVTLRCRATGSPMPTVKWKRDDNAKININKSLIGEYKYLAHPWHLKPSQLYNTIMLEEVRFCLMKIRFIFNHYTQKSANGITKRWSFRKSLGWIWERTCALRLMESHQQCLNGLKLVLIVSTNIYTIYRCVCMCWLDVLCIYTCVCIAAYLHRN